MQARQYAGEHRGHRLVERRSPRGDKTYRLPERLADRPVSESIRHLESEGWSRAEISKVTGILYQHVRNVLEGQGNGSDKVVRLAVEPDESVGSMVEEGQVGSKVAFADLVARVDDGAEITITREGEPVARLVRYRPVRDEAAIREAMARMDEIRSRTNLGGLRIKDLINEGRR